MFLFHVFKVFKAKLDIFLQNLKSGKYFGNRRTVYILRVIEYQHRGMPHVHIVIKLSDMPNDIEGKIRFIDEYITAKAPPVPLILLILTIEDIIAIATVMLYMGAPQLLTAAKNGMLCMSKGIRRYKNWRNIF
jgi:hypothetical protein